jgi:acetyl-CoA carboxylase carboxyl transferase subunit alpha
MAAKLKERLIVQLGELEKFDLDTLIEKRYARLMSYGN